LIYLQVAKVIQRFLSIVESQGGLSGHQRSMLKLMSLCKTAALGGHRERCDQCAHVRVHYNSPLIGGAGNAVIEIAPHAKE